MPWNTIYDPPYNRDNRNMAGHFEETEMRWAIMLPLNGGGNVMELCVCDSVEKLLAVLQAICNASKNPPQRIIVESRPE